MQQEIYENDIVQIIMKIDKAFEEQNYSDAEYRVNFKSEILLKINEIYNKRLAPIKS